MAKNLMKNQNNKVLFPVVYETDPEGGFVAFVPSLPGCHTQGDTLEEAEQNIKEATEAYLESDDLDNYANPSHIKNSYDEAVKKYSPVAP